MECEALVSLPVVYKNGDSSGQLWVDLFKFKMADDGVS